MMNFDLSPEALLSALADIIDVGGPVVVLILVLSVVTLAIVLYKFWQFRRAGVGQHRQISAALTQYEAGKAAIAQQVLGQSTSYLATPVSDAIRWKGADGGELHSDRSDAEAEALFADLDKGLGFLDMVAQLAPLIGLFGTVLGMIEAFQGLQEAGSAVDPTVLAGGIWVALLTTAAGLAVAMPTAAIHSWFSGALERDRIFANKALRRVFAPEVAAASELAQVA